MICRAKGAHISWEEMGITIPPLHLQDKTSEEIIFITRYNRLRRSGVSYKHIAIITDYLRTKGYLFEEAPFSAHLRLLQAHCAGLDIEEFDYQSAKRADRQISRTELLNLVYESRQPFTKQQFQQVQILLLRVLQPITREIISSYYGLDEYDASTFSLGVIAQNLHLSGSDCKRRRKCALRKLIDAGLIDILSNRPIDIRRFNKTYRQNTSISELNLKPRVHVALSRHGICNVSDLQNAPYETLAAIPGLCRADLVTLMRMR